MIIKLRSTQLQIGMFIHKLNCSWIRHPFFRNQFIVNGVADIRKIIGAGIEEVWIDDQKGCGPDLYPAQQITEDSAPSILDSKAENVCRAEPPILQSEATLFEHEIELAKEICNSAKAEVQRLFDDARVKKILDVRATAQLIEEVTESVRRRPDALLSVVQLKNHDNYTFMHSVAVCALMIALAQRMQMSEEQVRLAGFAGLFHDIGKATIPFGILTKPGKLTEVEFQAIKKHPLSGAGILNQSSADPVIQDVALHHHEKSNGTGYPHGLEGDEISVFAKMGAICDVYDAITSERSYKRAWDPAVALRNMIGWKGHFDQKILREFVNAVGLYPAGSTVRLSSNHLARVIETDRSNLEKPQVEIFYCLKKKERISPTLIDLSKGDDSLAISGIVDDEAYILSGETFEIGAL